MTKKDEVTSSTKSTQTAAPHPAQTLPNITNYKLLDMLGEGGFGVVYLADQLKPIKRKVALKVIKPGMDSKAVIARFEAERQALAMMNHPNVAKVFDAGTTDKGQPFFVMELVTGVSITEHCDRHKLNIEERLNLFIDVCEAVQHAHQKGIIHRDIKPSNILVEYRNDKSICKVIDFGVAKAIEQRLTEQTIFTQQGQLIGTPAYMSPEQAEMTAQDIDTRSDIYSLGVVLYQLLTGVTPFETKTLLQAGWDEIRRVIREQEPQKPSTKLSSIGDGQGTDSATVARNRKTNPNTLSKNLRGDLDWVTIKALEKDRTRRYATATELADDLRRHLKHEPVLASPPGSGYRFKKFIRRYRIAVGIGLGYAATITIALVVSVLLWQKADLASRNETEQRRLLEQEQQRFAQARRIVELVNQEERENALLAGLEAYPENPVNWMLLGDTLYEQRQYKESTKAYREAIRLDDQLAWAWSGLGESLCADGQISLAIDALQTSVGLDSELASAWASLSHALLRGGERVDAKLAKGRAIEIDPKLASTFFTAGHIEHAETPGLVVLSTPSRVRGYWIPQHGGFVIESIRHTEGVRSFLAGDTLPETTNRNVKYIVEVSIPLNDKELNKFPSFLDFRRAIIRATPEQQGYLLDDYFLPDKALRVFIETTKDQKFIVRRYRGVTSRKGVQALFLPRLTRSSDNNFDFQAINDIMGNQINYSFDEVLVLNELAFYDVLQSDRQQVVIGLKRYGSVPYRMKDQNEVRLFSIGIRNGEFSGMIIR